jgi:hypothetical protein
MSSTVGMTKSYKEQLIEQRMELQHQLTYGKHDRAKQRVLRQQIDCITKVLNIKPTS